MWTGSGPKTADKTGDEMVPALSRVSPYLLRPLRSEVEVRRARRDPRLTRPAGSENVIDLPVAVRRRAG